MEGKGKGKKKCNKETKEEVSRKRERVGEKREDGTVAVEKEVYRPCFR